MGPPSSVIVNFAFEMGQLIFLIINFAFQMAPLYSVIIKFAFQMGQLKYLIIYFDFSNGSAYLSVHQSPAVFASNFSTSCKMFSNPNRKS